jgi:hypothetical protein
MRRVLGVLSAALLAGLCQCTLLFDLSALDPVHDGSSGDYDAAESSASEPGDDGGADSVDETGDDEFAATPPDAPADAEAAQDATDASAPAEADTVPAEADTVDSAPDVRSSVDASRDAVADVVHDAPIDTAPPFDAASCPSILLAPSATVVASSTRTTNYANQAIDKQFTTRWESTQQADEPNGTTLPPQWIYLDFGAPVSVTRVRIDWQSACAQAYLLQVSEDTSTWVTLTNGSVINGTMNGSLGAPTDWSTDVDTTGLSGVGRYLRVYGTQRCLEMYGYSIWEMQVYGHGVSACAQGM